jgi:hypothetical protein
MKTLNEIADEVHALAREKGCSAVEGAEMTKTRCNGNAE